MLPPPPGGIDIVLRSLVVLLLVVADPSRAVDDPLNPLDRYCGLSWPDAFGRCDEPCPSGYDEECSASELGCHGYTGCRSKGDNVLVDAREGDAPSTPPSPGPEGFAAVGGSDVGEPWGQAQSPGQQLTGYFGNNRCGPSWVLAMVSCESGCFWDADCPVVGNKCWASIDCTKELVPVRSNILFSLAGEFTSAMGWEERSLFGEVMLEKVSEIMAEEKVYVSSANVKDQRLLADGGRGRRMKTGSNIVGGRRLPTASSSLEVSMVISGDYRPPPHVNMDAVVVDSINRASTSVVHDLRQRAAGRGSTRFFEDVKGLGAASVEEATRSPMARPKPHPTGEPMPPPTTGPSTRPTTGPTEWPTPDPSTSSPTQAPTTLRPTGSPTIPPTIPPSEQPARAWEQVLQTCTAPDMYRRPAKSFGAIFEIKTRVDANTVLIKGLDFYSSADVNASLSYEVWAKEGPWLGFEGRIDSFSKIANGTALSRGACEETTVDDCAGSFTRIPFSVFENVIIRGGGTMSHSFYVTLTTKELYYKRDFSTASTVDFSVQVGNQDIEVYEGAGVLAYPFNKAVKEMYYRRPRGFLGRIWYERNPCRDDGMDWPCQPTKRPTPGPSGSPTPVPTYEPTTSPSPKPTDTPSLSISPILHPTTRDVVGTNVPTSAWAAPQLTQNPSSGTLQPTVSPIVAHNEAETNVVIKLRDVGGEHTAEEMNRSEKDKFLDIMLSFLRNQQALIRASVNILNVTFWHQEVVTVEVDGGQGGMEPDSRLLSQASGLTGNRTYSNWPGKTGASSPEWPARSRRAKVAGGKMTIMGSSKSTKSYSVLVVTITIRTANSVIPPEVTNVLVLHVLEEEKAALVELFLSQVYLYSYFKSIHDISAKLIERVTKPPSHDPSSIKKGEEDVAETEEEEQGGRTNISYVFGVCVGFLWLLLTLYSLAHVAKARTKMRNKRYTQNNQANGKAKYPKRTMSSALKKDRQEEYYDQECFSFTEGLISEDKVDDKNDSGQTELVGGPSSSDLSDNHYCDSSSNESFFNQCEEWDEEEGQREAESSPTSPDPRMKTRWSLLLSSGSKPQVTSMDEEEVSDKDEHAPRKLREGRKPRNWSLILGSGKKLLKSSRSLVRQNSSISQTEAANAQDRKPKRHISNASESSDLLQIADKDEKYEEEGDGFSADLTQSSTAQVENSGEKSASSEYLVSPSHERKKSNNRSNAPPRPPLRRLSLTLADMILSKTQTADALLKSVKGARSKAPRKTMHLARDERRVKRRHSAQDERIRQESSTDREKSSQSPLKGWEPTPSDTSGQESREYLNQNSKSLEKKRQFTPDDPSPDYLHGRSSKSRLRESQEGHSMKPLESRWQSDSDERRRHRSSIERDKMRQLPPESKMDSCDTGVAKQNLHFNSSSQSLVTRRKGKDESLDDLSKESLDESSLSLSSSSSGTSQDSSKSESDEISEYSTKRRRPTPDHRNRGHRSPENTMSDKGWSRRTSINLPSVIMLSNFLQNGPQLPERKKHARNSEASSHLHKFKPRATDALPRAVSRPTKHLFKSMVDPSSVPLIVPNRPKYISKSSGPMSNRKARGNTAKASPKIHKRNSRRSKHLSKSTEDLCGDDLPLQDRRKYFSKSSGPVSRKKYGDAAKTSSRSTRASRHQLRDSSLNIS